MHETSHTDLGSVKFLETEMKKLMEKQGGYNGWKSWEGWKKGIFK